MGGFLPYRDRAPRLPGLKVLRFEKTRKHPVIDGSCKTSRDIAELRRADITDATAYSGGLCISLLERHADTNETSKYSWGVFPSLLVR